MSSKTLPIEQILSLLKETPPRLAELTAGLAPDQLRAVPGEGEWSAGETLAHLRACSEVWGGIYIMTLLAQENPTIRAVNPRTWIKNTDYFEQEFQASLRAFTRERERLLAVLEPLPPEGWARTNTLVGAGKPRLQTLLSHADGLARHERAHLRQIERIIEAVSPAAGRNPRR